MHLNIIRPSKTDLMIDVTHKIKPHFTKVQKIWFIILFN